MTINYKMFHKWWVQRLLKQKPAPFKYKNETDDIRSKCLVAILKKVGPQYSHLESLKYRMNRRTIENSRHRIHRDEFGKETVMPDPVFSANQATVLKSKWGTYLVLLIFSGMAECFMYVLTASTFMPYSSRLVQILVGLFFAIVFMFVLGYCFNIKEKYLEACDRFKAREIPEKDLKWLRYKLHFTYGFIIATFAALVLSGAARIYYFAGIDRTGMTDEEYHNKLMAATLAAAMTLIFTILVSFFTGFIKNEFSKLHAQVLQYRAWHRNQSKRDRCTEEFFGYVKHLLHVAEVYADEYWQWVIEIKRVFLEAEYDVQYESLYQEYWKLRCTEGFVVNDAIYRKFSVMQSAFEELFRYGILHDDVIMNKIKEAAILMEVPEEHIREHINAISEAKTRNAVHFPSANGQTKNTVFFNNQNNTGMNFTTIIIACIAITSLFSCAKKEPRQPMNLVTDIDISGSRNDSILFFYQQMEAEHIIPHIRPEDCHVVLPIDAGSVQSEQEIQIKDFARNNYHNEFAGQDDSRIVERLHRDSLRAFKMRFLLAFNSAIIKRKMLNHGTDIIGAIAQATKYKKPGHRNVMVLFSDMCIYQKYFSGLIDFEHGLKDTSDIRRFIAIAPRVDLEGWDVLVITGEQNTISAEKFMAIQKFWERWFTVWGANLRVYSSGSVSLVEKALEQ